MAREFPQPGQEAQRKHAQDRSPDDVTSSEQQPDTSRPPYKLADISPEKAALFRRWYGHTSWEGRSDAEFEKMREELRAATILDFEQYENDKDYRHLITENPRVEGFLDGHEVLILMAIHDRLRDIGITESQFEKMKEAFSERAVETFEDNRITGQAIAETFKHMSPEEHEQMEKDTEERNRRVIAENNRERPRDEEKK